MSSREFLAVRLALLTGIYDRLIKAISDIKPLLLLQLKIKLFAKSIDWAFFLPLVAGMVSAIYFFSGFIGHLLNNFPNQLYSFFIGLILAATFYLYQQNKQLTVSSFIVMIGGFLIAHTISGITVAAFNHSLPIIFISAVIAVCAMILPGISGAFILLLLNQYEFLISALHQRNILVILTFILGAVMGLLLFSKLLRYILTNHKTLTIYFLVGLMVGSLRSPINKIIVGNATIWSIIGWAAMGFILVLILEKPFRKNN